jgi:hypothetical protein
MEDSKFVHLFSVASAYFGLSVSAFFLVVGITAVGVNSLSFAMNMSAPTETATASVALALADDYGTGTTTSSVYCPQLSTTLQKGARDASTGGQVSELQNFLTSYYNLDENVVVGGYFGKLTQQYLIKFQTEHGLPALGIAGTLTRAKIANVCGSMSSPTIGGVVSAPYSLADIGQFQTSGASKQCTYSLSGSSYSYSVYVGNNKIAVISYASSSPQARKTYLLIDGGMYYQWSSATTTVIKSPVSSDLFKSTVKLFNCTDWTLDASVFQLPANATIVDQSQQILTASLASKRASIEQARVAFTTTPIDNLVSLVVQVRASTRTDIPNLRTFADTYGDALVALKSQSQTLQQKSLDNLSSADLDAILSQYVTLRTQRDIILSRANIIPTSETAHFLLNTPNITASTSTTGSNPETLTLTGPIDGSVFNVKSDMPVSWTVTNVPHAMRVEISTKLIKAAAFSTGFVSGGTSMKTVYTGNSSGSYVEQWGLNSTIPGTYSVTLQLEECDPAGCQYYYGPTAVLAQTAPVLVTLTGSPTQPQTTIGTTSVQILSPNGGETYSINSATPFSVRWTANGVPANAQACVTLQSSDNHYYSFPGNGCVAAQNGNSSVSGSLTGYGQSMVPGLYIASVIIGASSVGSGKDGATLAQDQSDQSFTLTQ